MEKKRLPVARRKLSKSLQSLLDSFDTSAQTFGIQLEHGFGNAVTRSGKAYEEDKAALVKRLLYLENSNRRLRNKIKNMEDEKKKSSYGERDPDWETESD